METDDTPPSREPQMPSVLAVIVVSPVAALVGGFAGWCMGASLGGVLQELGVPDAGTTGGVIGSGVGALFCLGAVAVRLLGRGVRSFKNRSTPR